jgi:hypothetical protein
MAISGFAGRFASARWRVALDVARWLFKQGRDRLNRNLSEPERAELWDLMKRSKGRRVNLSSREQSRFVALVKQGATGRGE